MKRLPDHHNNDIVIINKVEKKDFIPQLCFCFPLFICIVLFIIVLSSCNQNINERNDTTTIDKTLPRPSWVSKDPLVFVDNWDEMAIFKRRIGGTPVWQEDEYPKGHTEEAVIKLKDMGITMAILHFYKGFGLEAEKEHMEDSKKLAAICKKHGLKVGVYIGSTICYESFLLEKPEAEKWFVPDYMGQPVIYGSQTFRKRVYFMNPEYIEYMKRVVRIAIEDLKVDLIHFDNTSMQAEPCIFFHPMAIEDFRTYLKNKYSPELLKKRFGFSDARFVEPPRYNQPLNTVYEPLFQTLTTINDPLFQEWMEFRCQQLAEYYAIMKRYIYSLNSNVAIDNNPHMGLSGYNTIWDQGVDYPMLLPHTDFMWTEEGNTAGVNDEGVLISKIRTYKMARILNNRIFTSTGGSLLEMAESMAYNRQGIGMVGGMLAGDELPEKQRNYIKFFHENFNYYSDIVNVSDVAVLHSFASMANNNDLPYQSTYLFEQSLIQEKISFDIIFDDNLKDLTKYKVLVLADQECLNDEKLGLIRSFVKQGGGLVATEHTSLYTEWRQRQRDFGLNDLFQINPPNWRGSGSPEKILNIPIQKKLIGKGRVVYIPEIRPSITKPPAVAMTSNYWKLPLNWKVLIESVHWASDNSLTPSIEAPLTVTMELTEKEDQSALILHLINFDAKISTIAKIKVKIDVPEGKKVNQVTVMTPDGRVNDIIQFTESEKHVAFIVPMLSIYDIIVMNLE